MRFQPNRIREGWLLRFALLVMVLGLVAAACGSDSTDDTTETTAATETTSGSTETTAGSTETTAGSSDTTAAAGGDYWWQSIESGEIEVGVIPAEGTTALDALKAMGAELEADHPGSAVTFTFANTQARPALEQRWRTGDPLDVDVTLFDGITEQGRRWADEGFLLDLKPYLEQPLPDSDTRWIDTFPQGAVESMTHPDTGAIYGVPTQMWAHVMFYNKGMFDELGIAPPETWDDFLAAGEALKAEGIAPVALAGAVTFYVGMWSDHIWSRLVGYQASVDAIHGDGSALLAEPGFLKGLEMLQELRDGDFFIDGYEGMDNTFSQTEFINGKAGMILVGSWLMTEMHDLIPEGFEVGIVKFPDVSGGAGDQTEVLMDFEMWSIAAETENVELSLDWLRRHTSPEWQGPAGENLGMVPTIVGVSDPSSLPGIGEIISGASGLKKRHLQILGTNLPDYYMPEIQKMFFGVQDAQETLESLAAALKDRPRE